MIKVGIERAISVIFRWTEAKLIPINHQLSPFPLIGLFLSQPLPFLPWAASVEPSFQINLNSALKLESCRPKRHNLILPFPFSIKINLE